MRRWKPSRDRDSTHGTREQFEAGCRCVECRAAYREWLDDYERTDRERQL